MKRALCRAFVCLVLVTSCGRIRQGQTGEPVDPPPPPVEGRVATLVMWGAGYCKTCKQKLPEINSLLGNLDSQLAKNLSVVLYVPTGNLASEKPTQAIAEEYRDRLHLTAEARMDPWRWKHFREMKMGGFLLPAAVILDENGEVVRKFFAGDTSFIPREIVDTVAKQLVH